MSKRGRRRAGNSKHNRGSLRQVKQKNSLRRKQKPPNRRRPQVAQPSSRRASAPARSTGAQPAANFSSAISMLEMRERSVLQRAHLGSIQSDINAINNAFLEIPAKIAAVNKRGFVFTKDMDDALALVEDKWESGLQIETEREFDASLSKVTAAGNQLERYMSQLSRPNQTVVDRAESELNQLESLIKAAEQGLRGHYQTIKATIDEIYFDLAEADQAIDLLNDSDIELRGTEAVVLVCEAEWHEDGKDEGPDGYLYLTDQRLLFEQKEMVAEKKFLFVTTKSTEIQKLWISVDVKDIASIDHSEEKQRMLQWGKDEILSLTLSGQADFSRLRFHIKNQEAEDWVETLKLVLSGGIQEDRFDFDEEEGITDLIFPTACPNCMAAVPPLPGGVTLHECEFCGSTIRAEAPPSTSE